MMHWLRQRVRLLVFVARYDSTTWAELMSGFLLIMLRGVIILIVPANSWPVDVSSVLRLLGFNEMRWGILTVVLGGAQMLLAGSTHYRWRMAVLVAIMASFILVGVTFVIAGLPFLQIPLGIVCLVAFWMALLARLFEDRRHGKH